MHMQRIKMSSSFMEKGQAGVGWAGQLHPALQLSEWQIVKYFLMMVRSIPPIIMLISASFLPKTSELSFLP